jgi:hypothetical protein
MKPFRTAIPAGVSSHTLTLADPVFTAGSCFADCMGRRLDATRLPVMANPFGTLYNPASIHRALGYAIRGSTVHSPQSTVNAAGAVPPPDSYLKNGDIYLNYDFHSELSSLDAGDLQNRIRTTINRAHDFLSRASLLVITYGTAWVYTRNDTGAIVANCHKQPAALFSKSLLTADDIVRSFDTLHRDLMRLNPELRILLTVSPVRHLKDTLELNSVSKSILRVACHRLQEDYDRVTYFPAYEMMLDDLRDYRFYAADMLHPTPEAEDYIWEHFTGQYFSSELKTFASRWKAIRQALDHRPFHPTAQAHQEFLHETLKKLEDIRTLIDVDREIAEVRRQLI